MLYPYDNYKATEIPWITEIPQHWPLARNKCFLYERKESIGKCSDDHTLLSLTKKGVIIRDISTGKGKFPKSFDTYSKVKSGQIIFCLFDVDETPRTVGIAKHDGMITGAYNVFDIQGINTQYIYYYYLSLDNTKALKPLYTGLRKVINTSTFLQAKLPVPPRLEQDQIVRYLDWQNEKINKLIKAKRKEIRLLQEYRYTVIDNATTRGIDTNIPVKSSGVSWLPKIPEHWNMVYSKQLFALRKDKAFPNDEQLTSSQKHGIISQKEFMELEGRRVTVVLTGNDILKHVEAGDFVISMRSFQGGLEYSRISGKISSAYVMLIPYTDKVCDEYFRWLFKSKSYIKALQGTSDLVRDGQALRYANFAKVALPLFAKEEQLQIARYLDDVTATIDAAIEKLRHELKLLNEYRTRLIADVVTGKVNVSDIEVPEIKVTTSEEIAENLEDEDTEDSDIDEYDETEVNEDGDN